MWGSIVNVSRSGGFLVILRPPSSGSYSVVVADGGGGEEHGIAIARAGWLPPVP
jgi:hypothetical protein